METKGNDPINPTSKFEVHRIHGQENDVAMMRGGLTKLEYFAAMAMQGLLSTEGSYFPDNQSTGDLVAEAAVKYADALIKALNE